MFIVPGGAGGRDGALRGGGGCRKSVALARSGAVHVATLVSSAWGAEGGIAWCQPFHVGGVLRILAGLQEAICLAFRR